VTKFIILSVVALALFVANVFFGAVHIPASDVLSALIGRLSPDDAIGFIILGSRLPQAVTALLSGAGLGVAGLLLQTAFRNPLAGPSILGISSGAGLGVALVMLFLGGSFSIGEWSWGGYTAIVAGAVMGSMTVMAVLVFLSTVVRNDLMLLITGIMIGYLASSVVTLLSSIASAQGVQGYVMWGMGTFGDVSMSQLPVFSTIVIIGLVMSLLLAKPLNILLLGDSYARNLGVRVVAVRNMLLVCTGLLTGIITAYCGPVAFIGLAIPHVSRFYFHTDNHWILIPATMLTGAVAALACNLASTLPDNTVIPINALTSLIGVPVILAVILKRR
jgi:hypothetical protein